ncbi:MAG: glycosyltransferase [Enhydrobacter sp.]|nr:MAG: glycosyltransferase [Enhydrobacter sp.]
MNASGNGAPLVSILMFVRNGAASIDRALRSVRNQTWTNIEFVVQDAVSTDGTLEKLRALGSTLKLVSAPDRGPNEGLWRALNRCQGEFIGSCLADEELLPNAVEHAVRVLLANPQAGAITGDAIITDIAGRETGFWRSGPFNFIDYLMCDYTPYFVSSFFRRSALIDAGLTSAKWGKTCVEFELWCRLATVRQILYTPETLAKYAAHPGQSSNNGEEVAVQFAGRLEHIDIVCRSGGLVDDSPSYRELFAWGNARRFIEHALSVGRPETARTVHRITREFLSRFSTDPLHGRQTDRSNILGGLLAIVRRRSPNADILLPPPPQATVKASMYRKLANRYEALGRLSEALEMWRAIARLGGLAPDSGIGYTVAESRSNSSTAQST